MKSSAVLLRSKPVPGFVSPALVAGLLSLLIATAAWWNDRAGYILFYGDAAAHLNLSRSLIDSRTPGYDQLGTVWLPVLHVLCLPFVASDALWSSGLAGTIPVAICFVIAGTCLFLCAHAVYASRTAAAVAVACFALNPNLLYLGTIPMTEVVFLAGLFLLLLSVLRFRDSQRVHWIAAAVGACWFVSLTRYDGWFLIPFAGISLAMFAERRKWAVLFAFGAAAALAPAYWVAHNWWETGNALDFYNGPYSPAAIQGGKPYPGLHDWRQALQYYGVAGKLCSGWPLLLLGATGAWRALRTNAAFPIAFLLLTPFFYVWSMHSSGGTPIHVPSLWPFSYYNTRYGIAMEAVCAFAAGALVLWLPEHHRKLAWLIPLAAAVPWLVRPSPQNWICWKESQVNSDSRRQWTAAAAKFVCAHFTDGQTILTSSGDETGIYAACRVHLSDTLNIGNGPAWLAATARPDLFNPAAMAVAQQGDLLFRALERAPRSPYTVVQKITTKDDPPLLLYERKNQ